MAAPPPNNNQFPFFQNGNLVVGNALIRFSLAAIKMCVERHIRFKNERIELNNDYLVTQIEPNLGFRDLRPQDRAYFQNRLNEVQADQQELRRELAELMEYLRIVNEAIALLGHNV